MSHWVRLGVLGVALSGAALFAGCQSFKIEQTTVLDEPWVDPKAPKAVYVVKVKADKENAVYAKGEAIKFNVSLFENGNPVSGREMDYRITSDGSAPQTGKIKSSDKPVELSASLDKPGFVLCSVSCKDGDKMVFGHGGAAVEPLSIKAAGEPPADFDKFWDAKKAELDNLKLDANMVPAAVPDTLKDKVECFDVKINCPGGKPVSGYFARPVGAAAKSLPAMISYHGAGVRSASNIAGSALKGVLAMDINAHGIENGKPEEFYKNLSVTDLKDYPFFDIGDREKIYFLGMYLRVYRSLQFIKSQPEWDGKTLIVVGSSQGGGQALVAAGLDPQVTFCGAYVPALCDHMGIFEKRQSGWPRFVNFGPDGKPVDPKIVETVKYFDAATFASKIKAQSVVTVGFIDTTCSPTSVYSAFNNIKGPKKMVDCVNAGHANPKGSTDLMGKTIDDIINSTKSEKK